MQPQKQPCPGKIGADSWFLFHYFGSICISVERPMDFNSL